MGVYEKTDQSFGFDAVAVGDGHTDTNIRLAAVAMQQGLERGQQQHERGHAELFAQLLERQVQRGLQGDVQARPTKTLHRRPRIVRRQFQHRLLAAQLLVPVRQLPLTLARFHPVPLPDGVVGILDLQRRQGDVLSPDEGAVNLHQFADHDLHGGAIGDNVVLGQYQYVVVVGQV